MDTGTCAGWQDTVSAPHTLLTADLSVLFLTDFEKYSKFRIT